VALYFRMCRARDQLAAAAGERSWPADHRELYVLLGWVNSLMATAAQHVGCPAAAEELALAGLTYASVTGDRPLTAQLRLDLASIAYWSGLLRTCLDQADAGLEHVSDGPTAAMLHLIRARATARLGDTEVARHFIKEADQARDRGWLTDPAENISQIGFSPATHHYYTGSALSEIPDASQDAVTELKRAIELYTAAMQPGSFYEHDQMAARVDLSATMVRVGDLDAAEAAVGPVLALPCSRRISSLPHSFSRVEAELAAPQYRGAPRARDFTAAIQQFCAHTITPHLASLSGGPGRSPSCPLADG
jgi:hypothetical protein